MTLTLLSSLLAQETAVRAVNPPGWVGWLLAALAIILPIALWLWYRGERSTGHW
jgi:hypothetical protein